MDLRCLQRVMGDRVSLEEPRPLARSAGCLRASSAAGRELLDDRDQPACGEIAERALYHWGTYPGVIISSSQRQVAWLHKSALAVAEGTPVATPLESGYPRLHFSHYSSHPPVSKISIICLQISWCSLRRI